MIKTIILELRPRLQICNTFICLQKEINLMKIRIKLLEESIEITIENSTIKCLTKFIKLIPNSLSALNVTNNWICFRAQIKSDSAFGCFQTGIVTNLVPNINILRNSTDLKLLKEQNCNIICACCKNVLSKQLFVKRILPIPDMNYDLNEWFCCKHNHITVSPNLIPSESDIFYGSVFFIIHTNLFNNNLKIEGNTILCNRCLQHVGQTCTDTSFKLWSCSIDYNLLCDFKINKSFATDPFIDFLIAIKTTMTGMFGEEIILQSFVGKNIYSLILKPMDWHLNLLTEPKAVSETNVVTLQNTSVVKVLYKYEISKSTIDFVNKTFCEVGYLVIKAGLEHLLSSTKRFPQPHRTAADFYVGHICLENHK
ncbi:E3 ubiquitin-protein ligase E3D [Osmia lignaria lignaria]|uniref:E3 ubiquitin-protein ligase E3D n=1 Tax=Osmia lignaria lignaria TaxID=1437193 RepID=UPI00402B5FAB